MFIILYLKKLCKINKIKTLFYSFPFQFNAFFKVLYKKCQYRLKAGY